MRVGVDGFVKERLREAIDVRETTARAVAEAVGITAESVSRYSRGVSKPEPHILRAVAEHLRLPEAYFVRPLPNTQGSPLFFRSMAAATKRARLSAQGRHRWLVEAWHYLNEYVRFPSVALPDFDLPSDPERIDDVVVEEVAQAARHALAVGRGPVANVVRLIEANGGIVARIDLGSPRLDAFSQWVDGRPFIVLNGDKRAAARSRWDASHELGHMLLHRNVDPARLSDPAIFKRAEEQAHRFAGAFLLPADTFGRNIYVPTLSVLEMQKRIWGVSIAGMLRRLTQLGLVNRSHAKRIWRSYSRQGMRLREPLDRSTQAEQPETLRRAYEMLVNERGLGGDQLLASLPFDRHELQALLGLPVGFARERSADIALRGESQSIVPDVRPTKVLHWPQRGGLN